MPDITTQEQTIPPHWQRFSREAVLGRIPHKASDEVYAVYTHFEHEGVDNRGRYSLIIGAAVRPGSEVKSWCRPCCRPPGGASLGTAAFGGLDIGQLSAAQVTHAVHVVFGVLAVFVALGAWAASRVPPLDLAEAPG